MSRKRDEISESDDHNARGIELADRGWLDEAASEFKKAISLDPEAAHAHDNLATIYAEKGNLLEALSEFVEAVKLDGENPNTHHYLASFLAAQGPELAIAQYRRAIELEFDFPDAHLNLALSLADRGELDEAVMELETAHTQAPDDEMIEHELASCLIDVERFTDAIAHLKRIIKAHPEHVEAYVDLGIAYTAQGFFAQAEEMLHKALELDNHDFSAHYHLASLYAGWQRSDEALDHLEAAAAQDTERLQDWLGDDRAFNAIKTDKRFVALLGNED